MPSHRRFQPKAYEDMIAEFSWKVPKRYIIAADTVDKHESDGPAMVWKDWQGNEQPADIRRLPE